MSRIRQDLRTYLMGQAALTAIVGNHIFQSRVPKGDTPLQNFPALVYRRARGGHEHDLDGSAGCAKANFQITAVSTSAPEVDEICEIVRDSLQGYRGAMGTSDVLCITLNDEFDECVESTISDNTAFYMTILLYTITHREAIPTYS